MSCVLIWVQVLQEAVVWSGPEYWLLMENRVDPLLARQNPPYLTPGVLPLLTFCNTFHLKVLTHAFVLEKRQKTNKSDPASQSEMQKTTRWWSPAAGGVCTLAAVLQIDRIIFSGTMYLIGIFCIWSDYSIQIRNILLWRNNGNYGGTIFCQNIPPFSSAIYSVWNNVRCTTTFPSQCSRSCRPSNKPGTPPSFAFHTTVVTFKIGLTKLRENWRSSPHWPCFNPLFKKLILWLRFLT